MNETQNENDPQISQKSDPALAEETAIVNQQPTENVSFEDVLQQAAKEPKDPFDSEPACLKLMEEMKDLSTVRRLVKERSDPSESPTQLGQFELLERLGQGGMGKVYKARHAQLGKIQVVKVLHEFRLNDQQATARFRQEMRAIGALTHPNIVAAHHADEVDGVPYLVMDYVEGQSLLELLNKRRSSNEPLPIGAGCELVRQAAIGLQYAHEQGIVHRDIKPGNLMLDEFGVVRILDLGLARIATCDGDNATEELTSEYQILGTPDYMSPEQLRSSKDVDARADVYALGATLYCLLTGRAPYGSGHPSGNILDKAMQVMNSPVPEICEEREDIPDELGTLITHSLQKSPDDRISTAGELAQQLATWTSIDSLSEFSSINMTRVESGQSVDPAESTRKFHQPQPQALPQPKRNSNWQLATMVGFLFVALFSGVIYKLSLPDGGTLLVECDDPDANISIQAVQGAETETLAFSQDGPKSYTLDVGNWKLSIAGLDADQFDLDQESVTISKGGKQRLIVKRIEAKTKGSSEPKIDLVSKTPKMQSTGQENRVSDKALQQFANAIDWKPGDPERMLPGMVIQPATLDDVFDWQMIPCLRVFGTGPDYRMGRRRHFDVDSTGTYFAQSGGTYATIRDIKTGVIRVVIPGPLEGRRWDDIRFHPDGTRFAIVAIGNNGRAFVEVRDLHGRLKQRWADELLTGNWMNLEWTATGERLVVVADSGQIATYSEDGQQLSNWQPDVENEQYKITDHSLHPDGEFITLICSDGKIRNWDFLAKQLTEFLEVHEADKANSSCLRWNPDGNSLCVSFYIDNQVGPEILVMDRDGKIQSRVKPDPWSSSMQSLAWSPDGRFLVTADGHIFDRDLKHIRRIELERNIYPIWQRPNEIAGWNDIYEANSYQGWPDRLSRYSPSGQQLDTPNAYHPLETLGASWNDAGTLTSIHRAPFNEGEGALHPGILYQWTPTGQGQAVEIPATLHWRSPLAYRPRWSNQGQSILIGDSKGAYEINEDGSLASEDSGGGSSIRSPNGKLLAKTTTLETESHLIEIEDLNGTIQHSFSVKNGWPQFLAWSPDSTFLTWNRWNPDSQYWSVNVVDLKESDPAVRSFPHYRTGSYKAFSPDSNWLAFIDNIANTTQQRIFLHHLKTKESFTHTSELQLGVYPAWSADSKTLFAGQLFHVGDDGTLTSIGDVQPDANAYSSFDADDRLFFWGNSNRQRSMHVISSNGDLEATIPLNPMSTFYNANANLSASRQRYENFLVGRIISDQCQSIAVIDSKSNQFSWNGFAFHDGATLTLDPGGKLLHGPGETEIDRYVIHMLRYPGGRTIPLSRSKFLNRVSATTEQKAILWAIDLGATIRLVGQNGSLEFDEQSMTTGNLPDIKEVASIDLTNAKEVSLKGLGHLKKFSNLKHLNLRGSAIIELPDLQALSQLESLDLSETEVADIAHKIPANLKKLSLAKTKVSASIVSAFQSQTQLESLDLSGTAADNFTLLDLASISTLKNLTLINVAVSKADIEQLQQKLPECIVRTE